MLFQWQYSLNGQAGRQIQSNQPLAAMGLQGDLIIDRWALVRERWWTAVENRLAGIVPGAAVAVVRKPIVAVLVRSVVAGAEVIGVRVGDRTPGVMPARAVPMSTGVADVSA